MSARAWNAGNDVARATLELGQRMSAALRIAIQYMRFIAAALNACDQECSRHAKERAHDYSSARR
jgi:hypothetical protein